MHVRFPALRLLSLSICLLSVQVSLALAGVNERGFLLVHTDDSISYTWDDVSSYSSYMLPDCPWDPECTGDSSLDCQASLSDLVTTSGRPQEEPVVFWVISAFPTESCPRVAAAAFGLDWDVGGNWPTIVGWGGCGDVEFSHDGWPHEPGSGTVVTFSNPRTHLAAPIYWFAAFSYYGEAVIRIASHPGEGQAVFADDSVPAVLDPVPAENLGAIGLGGAVGLSPYIPDSTPVIGSSWGGVKSLFRDLN